jgi:hypothetical protein
MAENEGRNAGGCPKANPQSRAPNNVSLFCCCKFEEI